jgi:hypothetical protein
MPRAVVKDLALAGQFQRPAGPLEKTAAEQRLQPPDLHADGGLGAVNSHRRTGEAAVFDDLSEGVQEVWVGRVEHRLPIKSYDTRNKFIFVCPGNRKQRPFPEIGAHKKINKMIRRFLAVTA